MGNFFISIQNYYKFLDYAEFLDWLFCDCKFSTRNNWTSGYVGSFTKAVIKLFGKENYNYGYRKSLDFKTASNNQISIISAKGDSEGRDIIRHIRNGIAHGNVKVKNIKSEIWIEILDFNKTKEKEKTAYINMPFEYLASIFQLYKQKEKQLKGEINK